MGMVGFVHESPPINKMNQNQSIATGIHQLNYLGIVEMITSFHIMTARIDISNISVLLLSGPI